MEGTSNNNSQNLTRAEIEALLNIQINTDDALDPKVKWCFMMALITKLQKSVRGYQEFEGELKESLKESMTQKEALSIEVGCLKGDSHQVRELVKDLTAQVSQYKECTGGVTSKLIQLEATCTSQSDTIRTLQEELATAETKLEGLRV